MKYFNVPITIMQGVYVGTKSGEDFIEEALLFYCYEEYIQHQDKDLFCRYLEYLGFYFNEEYFNKAQKIYDTHHTVKTRVGIKDDWIYDFSTQTKSKKDWQVFMAFLGLKTHLGKKMYHFVTTKTMIARMLGFATNMDCFENLDIQLSRYQREKILAEVAIGWHLLSFSSNNGIRGFYISTKLTLQELKNLCDLKVSAIKKYKQMKQNLK